MGDDLTNSIIGLGMAGMALGIGAAAVKAGTRMGNAGSCGCHKAQARKSHRRSKR